MIDPWHLHYGPGPLEEVDVTLTAQEFCTLYATVNFALASGHPLVEKVHAIFNALPEEKQLLIKHHIRQSGHGLRDGGYIGPAFGRGFK